MDENETDTTQIALHAVRNVIGSPQQEDLFSEQAEDFSKEFGVKIGERIERFGIDLTEHQTRIMEGILHGFSQTGYQGNIESKPKSEIADEQYGGKLPDTYRYIERVPRLRATQSEILRWSGVNTNSIEAWSRAVKAIKQLGVKQYCFFYDRLALDENGNTVKEKDSDSLKKEMVVAVDTLFTIKEVRDSAQKLKYYEIVPSPIFLDQRESYFILVPNNWREEVRRLYGSKKASAYTFSFLNFLRYQYELKRRSSSEKKPYRIRWSPERIAQALRMPESTYKKRKKRANQILQDAYDVAKRLGYLEDYERLGYLDVLTLNEARFFDPSNVERSPKPTRGIESKTSDVMENPSAAALFDLFHECRLRLDEGHEKPEGVRRDKDVAMLTSLLGKRSESQIKQIIEWSITDRYWASRLSNVRRLMESFGEAVASFKLTPGTAGLVSHHQKIAQRAYEMLESSVSGARIEVLSKYVEVGTGTQQPDIVEYGKPDFESRLKASLQRWGFRTKQTVEV